MPGAGLEAGEDHEEAAQREVWEETKMSDIRIYQHSVPAARGQYLTRSTAPQATG